MRLVAGALTLWCRLVRYRVGMMVYWMEDINSNMIYMMNAVSCYDFTSFDTDIDVVKTILNRYCKRWDFQQEECPTTGKLHLQGRFKLKVKERMTGVRKKFNGWHISVTSEENVNNVYYVTKEDTRVAGPWSSTDTAKYIPRQIREIERLKPWQQRIVDDAGNWDTRTINVILDRAGNTGKSTLCAYAGVHGIGRKIPYCNDFRDIMRMVMDTPASRLYLIDMPRALRKDQLLQFYAGIEELKNGYAFDDRYRFRERWIDCPNIWVFTNIEPDRGLLSADRWRVWSIVDDDIVEANAPLELHDAILGVGI